MFGKLLIGLMVIVGEVQFVVGQTTPVLLAPADAVPACENGTTAIGTGSVTPEVTSILSCAQAGSTAPRARMAPAI